MRSELDAGSLANHEGIIKEGWVRQQSRRMRRWDKRWLVLTPTHLRSYKDRSSVINLAALVGQEHDLHLNDCVGVGMDDTGLANSFTVNSSNAAIHFSVMSTEDKHAWLKSIDAAISAAHPEWARRTSKSMQSSRRSFQDHALLSKDLLSKLCNKLNAVAEDAEDTECESLDTSCGVDDPASSSSLDTVETQTVDDGFSIGASSRKRPSKHQ
jgi:uncharacterized protein YukE